MLLRLGSSNACHERCHLLPSPVILLAILNTAFILLLLRVVEPPSQDSSLRSGIIPMHTQQSKNTIYNGQAQGRTDLGKKLLDCYNYAPSSNTKSLNTFQSFLEETPARSVKSRDKNGSQD
jgi:hypothetical protein